MKSSEPEANIAQQANATPEKHSDQSDKSLAVKKQAKEYGGPKGLEPTRYGDWEKNGRCVDF